MSIIQSLSANNKMATPNEFLNYQGTGTLFDEMCVNGTELRPHWEYLMRALAVLGPKELTRRRAEARGLLRENGVTYQVSQEARASERGWELDLIPLLIASEEWRVIERGLAQRALLLKLVLKDLYGPRQLLQKGIIPAEMIYSHPGFLRACTQIEAPGDRYHLPFYAADLARDADGQFCVIRDRTQAPPGAGYALENRIVLSRVMPSLFRDSQVHRLAMFFRTLRTTLLQMSWRQSDDARVVMLSPGANHETYFEHAYLAKYLGYTLIEGADLTVRDGGVALKTLEGLQPIDVIMRWVDDSLCDPLELRQDSLHGVAGLLQAARMKRVAIANPLGSGVLENPALLSVMPQLAKYFLSEDLLLPTAKTWWCGDPKGLAYVLAHLDTLLIKPIVEHGKLATKYGPQLAQAERDKLRAQILAKPHYYTGQEKVPSSTIPVFNGTQLEARQMVLRTFVVASDEDYLVMPGGLARVASAVGELVDSGQSGGLSKDTWVLASEPEKQVSLLPSNPSAPFVTFGRGELPSRVAENLFWLGRYAERAEGIVRLLRTVLLHLQESAEFTENQDQASHSLLRAVTHLTETYPGFVKEGAAARLADPETELLSVFLDRKRVGSLSYNLQSLLYAVGAVRDRLSPDIWRVFNEINESLQRLQKQREASGGLSHEERLGEMVNAALEQLNQLVTAFAAFTGLAVDNLTHSHGWQFLMIGRRLERGYQAVHMLQATLCVPINNEALLLERLLYTCDSIMTYRRRYRTQVQTNATVHLLVHDETNPRSLSYQLKHLHDDIQKLPRDSVFAYQSREERLVLEALTQIRLSDAEELVKINSDGSLRPQLDQLLVRLNHLLPELSNAITNSYFSHAEQPRQLIRLVEDPQDPHA